MEFTAAANKRLSQYAFLPSRKQKKYSDVHSLFLKAAHSYLQQAAAPSSSAPSSSTPSPALFALAGESFCSAALLASRKLHSPSSAFSSYLEAALAYQSADDTQLAYDCLRKAMEQRDACAQGARSSITSLTDSPTPATLAPPTNTQAPPLRPPRMKRGDPRPARSFPMCHASRDRLKEKDEG